MRTTVDIADPVYAELKVRAAEERTSVKALLDQAAKMLLTDRRTPKQGATKKRAWPAIGSASSAKVGPFTNDFAFFGEPDVDSK